MDDNVLDILGLQLVDYFISHENYRAFNVAKEMKTQVKGEVYLINKDSSAYHVIKIIKENNYNVNHLKNKDDEVLTVIKDQLIKEGLAPNKMRFLVIILNDSNNNESHNSPSMDVIIATSDKVVNELAKHYPMIQKVVKVELPANDNDNNSNDNDSNDNDNSDKKLSDSWKKVNFQNRRYLSYTLKKCSNANLVVTWFLFIIPIITYFAFTIALGMNKDSDVATNFWLQHLLFGGSHHNLIFGAHQFWRWFVYPFAGNEVSASMPINLLFALWMFYRVGRFIEGFYGWWKALIIWLGAMILTGILQSTVDTNNIMSGFWVFALISLGAMLPFIWNYKLFKTPIMTRFMTTFFIMLFYWYFTDSRIVILLYWMIAFTAGWLIATLVGYHNRKITVFYAFSPVALGALVLVAGLLFALNPYYPTDNNGETYKILRYYQSVGLISADSVRAIMWNFFHVMVP